MATTKSYLPVIASHEQQHRGIVRRESVQQPEKPFNDEEVAQYKIKIQQLEQRLQELERIVASQPSFGHHGLDSNHEDSTVQSPVCHTLFPRPIPSTMALWSAHLGLIHNISRLSNDRKHILSDFTAELLHLISNRLPLSVKTVPRHWDSVERVLDVGYQRYKYLDAISKLEQLAETPDVDAPRKLKVLIMGGSVLHGINCVNVLFELGVHGKMNVRDRHCNWANRLEEFLNQLLGPAVLRTTHPDMDSNVWDLVQVSRVSMGGTNTQTGQMILEYDLLPVEARHPDVIINAYSTNDMHAFTMSEAAQGNVTLRDKVFDMIQGFVRHVLQMQIQDDNCNNDGDTSIIRRNKRRAVPPLLLHMDDYLGNEQREIWATTSLSQSVQVLANYYGFTSMSYADVVRDLVYGDTHEMWFSPSGWWRTRRGHNATVMLREIHPGMGMHITSMWVTAFTMLHLATTFCSLEWSQSEESSLATWRSDTEPLSYSNLLDLPPLNGRYQSVSGKPRRPPRDALLPPMTKELSLENITEMWRAETTKSTDTVSSSWSSSSYCNGRDAAVRCPFSWVANLVGKQNDSDDVKEYFRNQTIHNEGWDVQMDHGKLGYAPIRGRNSSMTLEFQNVTQSIRTVTFFIMKSYGPKWANSRMQVRAHEIDKASSEHYLPLLLLHVLEGFHDKQTSETYTIPLQLNHAVTPGRTFRLQMDLVDGETFKLLGLAICS